MKAQAYAAFVRGVERIGGFGGKSDQLNAYNTYMGDPGFFRKDLERYRRATGEGLRRAAARWLVPDGRVVLSVVPRGRVALALERSSPAVVS